ncbi:MAG TPA: polyphosphate kinase 1 [Candidatus Ruthenibacterium merdigallinarum]|nr:polyphosphate kinase 1 [Candidatus Ruthenibacterium merdigallinarum]
MEQTCFENRELSWLRFNERVLEEAEDVRVPLCERLSFLSIFQSNLDEFFMVRIGSLHDQMLLDRESRENKTNMTPGEQIDAALERVRALCRRRDAAYAALMGQLAEQGVTIVDFHSIGPESEQYLEAMFRREFMPLLSTFIVGKKQSFPFLANKDIYAIAVLSTKAEKKKIGIIPCASGVFPRLIPVPERAGCYILAEELILHCLPALFPRYKITSKTLARITRNADIDADSIYDEDLNYRDHMEEVIKLRRRLCPVRLELSRAIDIEVIETLCAQLQLEEKQVFEYDAPLDLAFLYEIRDELRGHGELFYAPRHPQDSPDVDLRRPICEQIAERDILLHYPYQSIRPFLQLLSEAARDEQVVSIKMTLYRLARDSKVVEALVEAAENGKQVDVLVELKARFDEANNIAWSRRLERAGCHVIYGLSGLKVHSKLCLITRKTPQGVQYITQIGTGNYNEKTSRLYTDLSLMTARPELGAEAAAVFAALTLGETVDHTQRLLVAPHCLQNKLLDMIDDEISKVRAGGEGFLRIKINSLSSKALIDKLIEASCAGVHIEMIVRGICCLRGGVPGKTENLHVVSVVGRYLEHSRIYIFGKGEAARYYIGSADWMTRNTLRRVEVAAPVYDPALQRRLANIFDVMWRDNRQARDQQPDGSYVRRMPNGDAPLACQDWLYDEAYRTAHRLPAHAE